MDLAKQRAWQREILKGGVCRKTQTDHRTFAEVCARCTRQEGLICSYEEKKVSQ